MKTPKKLPPSTFTAHPWNSTTENSESETIAANIMRIRKRNGDKWKITWEQYSAARKKDGATDSELFYEKEYFDEVMPLVSSAANAIKFSPVWKKAAKA